MDYNQSYSKSPSFFGQAPDPLLKKQAHLILPQSDILDIGCGQGRHLIFLSKLGHSLTGIDPSSEAIECASRAMAHYEDIELNCTNFEYFNPVKHYHCVLIFGLIQLLSRSQIKSTLKKAYEILHPGGLVFATAFTVDDPSHTYYKDNWTETGTNSYLNENEIRTFLTNREMPELFSAFSTEYYNEFKGPLHRHGSGKEHYHVIAEGIFMKTGV